MMGTALWPCKQSFQLPAPEKTLQAFAEHGVLKDAMVADGGDAEARVDIGALAIQLQCEGAQSFVKSWRQLLLQRLADKSAAQLR